MNTSLITNLAVSASFAGSLLLSFSALAQGGDGRVPAAASGKPVAQAPAGQRTSGADEKVDISDLEKKYWSTKDTDFNVVQNRLYSKAGRFLLSGFYGTLVNDPWSTGQAFGGSASYYFTETLGVEATFEQINSINNSATNNLISKSAYPDHNKVNSFFGMTGVWAPFYAKMSVMTSTIIYFDMQLGLGVGMQSYVQQRDDGNQTKSTPALEFDVTQHFYISKNFAVRFDFKNRWYANEIVWYRSTTRQQLNNQPVSNNVDNTTILMGGLTFMF